MKYFFKSLNTQNSLGKIHFEIGHGLTMEMFVTLNQSSSQNLRQKLIIKNMFNLDKIYIVGKE